MRHDSAVPVRAVRVRARLDACGSQPFSVYLHGDCVRDNSSARTEYFVACRRRVSGLFIRRGYMGDSAKYFFTIGLAAVAAIVLVLGSRLTLLLTKHTSYVLLTRQRFPQTTCCWMRADATAPAWQLGLEFCCWGWRFCCNTEALAVEVTTTTTTTTRTKSTTTTTETVLEGARGVTLEPGK